MSSSAARPVLNTLSSTRQRTLPKSFDFGGLTLNLEKAAARASKSSDVNVRKQFQPNETSRLLDRMAARAPGAPSPVAKPIVARRRSEPRMPQLDAADSSKINNTRSRFASRLPDPTKPSDLPSLSQRRPEYIREVSSLDKLAAESGIDSSTNAIRKQRTYKNRLQARPQRPVEQAHTRFALPRKQISGPGQAGARARRPPGTNSPGQSSERRQTRAQEEESARQAAIQARKSAAPTPPRPYDYAGLEASHFSPVLQKLAESGSRNAYEAYRHLAGDGRDAVRLVVGNRSIVQKQVVLKKIDAWIPAAARSSSSGPVTGSDVRA